MTGLQVLTVDARTSSGEASSVGIRPVHAAGMFAPVLAADPVVGPTVAQAGDWAPATASPTPADFAGWAERRLAQRREDDLQLLRSMTAERRLEPGRRR